MEELLRKEVLELNAFFSTDIRSNRVELQVDGAGNDLAESRRAIEWMRLILFHPDWRPENLPRLRDLVTQSLSRLRATMQEPEESWVMNPVWPIGSKSNPLYLTTSSFLTRAYNADRLRWMLADAGTAEQRAALAEFLTMLSGAANTRNRDELKQMLAAVSEPGPLAKDIAQDLTQLLSDIPDASLKTDWPAVCNQMRADILVTPEKTLARLNSLRESLLTSGGARAWNVGSHANLDQLDASLSALTSGLRAGSAARATYGASRLIDQRLRAHQSDSATPALSDFTIPILPAG